MKWGWLKKLVEIAVAILPILEKKDKKASGPTTPEKPKTPQRDFR